MYIPEAETPLFLLVDPVLEQFKTLTVHSDPVILNLQKNVPSLSSAGDRDQPSSSAVFDAVIESVFNKRLQDQLGNQAVLNIFVNIYRIGQNIAVADLLDLKIGNSLCHFRAQRMDVFSFA